MVKTDPSLDKGLLRMAGIVGILAGSAILTSAVVAGSNNILFFHEVFEGSSVDSWVENVRASPVLARVIMGGPALGFACMLIAAMVLYQYIGENSWQKNLSLGGYLIGVPVAVGMFISHLSLMNEVLLLYGQHAELDAQFQLVASVRLHYFQVINLVVGPFFVIVLGTTMMAWAALKAGSLPKWICFWLIACGVLVFISFFGFFVPVLGHAGIAAPLHMLGFVMLGAILLRRSLAGE